MELRRGHANGQVLQFGLAKDRPRRQYEVRERTHRMKRMRKDARRRRMQTEGKKGWDRVVAGVAVSA